MTLCDFAVTLEGDGGRVRYQCAVCGRVTNWTDKRPEQFRARCLPGEQGTLCPHLGPITETITRDLLACGCQTIRLHRCQHFAELVTIQPIRRPNAVDTAESLQAAVSEFFPAYRGRTCQMCEIPARGA
jgi:hypothetical protein